MAAAGPFEPRPLLAIAVSGGPDSLGLLCLARRWCAPRQGRVVALIVDHGLRPESARETAGVAAALRAREIEAVVLHWRRPDNAQALRQSPPPGGLQAAARDARYRLLTGHCRDHGIAHLLLGHHRGDQAETVAMRRQRGSGEGLAGMALSRAQQGVRLLRPALDLPRHALAAWALRDGFVPVDDPSNRDRRFERVRWRERLRTAPAETARLLATAGRTGQDRAVQEAEGAVDLAGCVSLHPAGFARLDGAALARLSRDAQLALLRALLGCIGEARYRPDGERLRRLHDRVIVKGRAGTLAGARLLPERRGFLVVREHRRLPAPQTITACGAPIIWDRFRLLVPRLPAGPQPRLAALGHQVAPAHWPSGRWQALPPAARETLPALWQADRLIWAAFLAPERDDAPRVRWQPGRPLTAKAHWREAAPL